MAVGLRYSMDSVSASEADPYAGIDPMATSHELARQGMASLDTIYSDDQRRMGALRPQQIAQPATASWAEPKLQYSPAKRQLYINGVVIDEDDDQRILESEALLSQPGVGGPQGGDWVDLPIEAYAQIIQSIKDPSLGTLFKKNFGRGTDSMQMLAGRAMQLAGAEETGGSIVDTQLEELRKTSPYERMATDIGGDNTLTEWAVANLGQFGPNLVENVVTAAVGATMGAVAGGGPNPLSALGGLVLSLGGKQFAKQALLTAAKKYTRGEVLDSTEEKLIREFGRAIRPHTAATPAAVRALPSAMGMGRTQSMLGGATALSGLSGYGQAVGDIYGEHREQGATPDDMSARLSALSMGVPYVALDLLPEAAGVARFMGRGAARPLANFKGMAKAGEVIKRGTTGAIGGGLLEGTGEAGQEALLLASTGQDFGTSESRNRLINSFLAGALPGGVLGAGVNLRGAEPVDLLDTKDKPAPQSYMDNGPLPPTGPTFMGMPAAQPVWEMPPVGTGPSGLANTPIGRGMVPALTGLSPDGFGVQQGVMDVGTQQYPMTQEEVDSRGFVPYMPVNQRQQIETAMQELDPGIPPAYFAPQTAPVVDPNQGALQFAPPAPAPVPTTAVQDNAMTRALKTAERNRAYQDRDEQLARERDRTTALAEAQRQMQIAERGTAPVLPVPRKKQGQRQTQQQDLFAGQPRPSRAEGLRRGIGVPDTAHGYQGPDVVLNPQQVEFPFARDGLEGMSAAQRLKHRKQVATKQAKEEAAKVQQKQDAIAAAREKRKQTIAAKKAAQEKAAQEKAAQEKAAQEKAAQEKAAQEKAAQEKAAQEKPVAKVTQLKRGKGKPTPEKADAVQEPSTEKVPAGEQAGTGKAVGAGKAKLRRAAPPRKEETEKPAVPDGQKKVTHKGWSIRMPATNDVRQVGPMDKSDREDLEGRLAEVEAAYTELHEGKTTLHKVLRGVVGKLKITRNGEEVPLPTEVNEDTFLVIDAAMDIAVTAADKYLKDHPGAFKVIDSGKDATPMPLARVHLLVRGMLSKFLNRPVVSVYKNVDDLKARNPELHAAARAAVPEGKWELSQASGYAFGGKVIIFSDNIRTEAELRFVVAHEVFGHYGLRSIMPKREREIMLQKLYDTNPDIQAAADRISELYGTDKITAVEEYIADNAADLETSVVARIWNAIKSFLNKLNIKFHDDEARYIVGQMRRYVRGQEKGFITNPETIQQRMEEMNEGRFSTMPAGDLHSRAVKAGVQGTMRSQGSRGFMQVMQSVAESLKGNFPGTASRLLENFQSMNNKARRSYGLNQIYQLFESRSQMAFTNLTKYQDMTAVVHTPRFEFLEKMGLTSADKEVTGVLEAEKDRAGMLLAYGALNRSQVATDTFIEGFEKANGLEPLITIGSKGKIHLNEDTRKAMEDAGFVSAEQFSKGIAYEAPDGTKAKFQFDVTEDSPEWKIYEAIRKAINESQIDLLLANHNVTQAESKRVVSKLNETRTTVDKFDEDDIDTIRRIAHIYNTLKSDKKWVDDGPEFTDADHFLTSVGLALFDPVVAKVWAKDKDADLTTAKEHAKDKVPDFTPIQHAKYDEVRKGIATLQKKVRNDEESFRIQKTIRDIYMFTQRAGRSEFKAKRSILSGYVPFARYGNEQVRIAAYDENGKPVKLLEQIRATLPYRKFEKRADADAAAAEWNSKDMFGEHVWELKDADEADVKVYLKAEVSRARQGPDIVESVDFDDFLYVLNRLDISLAPAERNRVNKILTSPDSYMRHNLPRGGIEGWDKRIVRAASENLEGMAHLVAKKLYRPRLDDILMNDRNWTGDAKYLEALKNDVEQAPTETARAAAKRAYDEYAYMYMYMAPSGEGKTVTIGGKESPLLGRGNDYRADANQLIQWHESLSNITDSTEDILSGEVGSRVKMLVILMQLGGSVATAAANFTSLVTHTLPYMAFYNEKKSFGGGYGMEKSASAIYTATGNTKHPKFGTVLGLTELLDAKTYTQYGLTEAEIKFLITATKHGKLQAAQANALIGTARGKIFMNKAQSAVKAWMSMFNYTEQLNRRATALAVYRLERERLLSQGVTDENKLNRLATKAAEIAVDRSQGNYAMFNRSELARGNVAQFLFMYKMFVINSVQMLGAMDASGRALMLGMLFFASGLRGLPFAEDIMDILDTLAQKFGLTSTGTRKAVTDWADAIAPGISPYLLNGFVDPWADITASSRIGQGNIIPLSGSFLAGADPGREALDFVGPVASGLAGVVGMAGDSVKYAAEMMGIRDDTTTVRDIFRDSPIAALRSLSDSMSYYADGRLTNAQGKLVSKEAPMHVVMARLLGFYPASASEQNDIVRMAKHIGDYAKEIKAGYVSAYNKARADNDFKTANRVQQNVRKWNRDAKGTGLEINDFSDSANRAYRELQRPLVERYLKSAPKSLRPHVDSMVKAAGYEW